MIRKIFLVIACLGFLFSFMAVPVQAASPIIDGVKEVAWGTPIAIDPLGDMTEPNLDLHGLYVTEDTDNLYIGFDAFASTWGMAYGIYIDTDHTDGSGGTSDPWGRAINAVSMHLPEYTLYVWHEGTDDVLQDVQLNHWNGSSWSYGSLLSQGGEQAYGPANDWIEYRVPKAALGNPTSISLELFSTGGGGHAQDSVPSDPNIDYSDPDWGGDITTLSAFILFPPPTWYVRGDFNGWETEDPMYDDGTHGDVTPDDGIFTSQVTIESAGHYEFRIAVDDWSEIYPESGNSWLETAVTDQTVTITFDTNVYSDGWQPQTNITGVSTDPGTWTAVGDWQGWDNNDPVTNMTAQGGGVYELTASIESPGSYQFKAVKTGTWDAIGSDGRSVNANTSTFITSQAGQNVIFRVDACTGRVNVTVNLANIPPVADANGPYTGFEGAPIMFDGSGSTDADGTIVSYHWNYGDGNTGSGVTSIHTYISGATYTVTLTVTDDDGDIDTATSAVEILTPADAVKEALDYIDDVVESGDLIGVGKGNSANGKLGALIHMLERAYDLINGGDLEDARIQLEDAYKKCDGNPKPPDFVAGSVAEELANMIMVIRISLGEDIPIGWANLQWPPTIEHFISVTDRTDNIHGQVWIEGVTSMPGQAPYLRAQSGFGPEGSDPDDNPDWTWVEASFNVDAGNNDEFIASLLPETTGTFDYVYRYTTNNGLDWLYGDLNGPIPEGGLPSNPGTLTVIPSGDTTPPKIPAGLHVTEVRPTMISLAWDTIIGDPTLYGYEIARSDSSSGPYTILARVTSNVYVDNSVVEGNIYYYVVRAVDTSFNRSPYSSPVQVTASMRTVTATFNVAVPVTTDATGKSVYVAGTLGRLDGDLPDWDPAGVVLTKVDATHWTITLTGDEGTYIEYKYALGSWDNVEKGAACDEINNRLLTLVYGSDGLQLVDDLVLNWRNVSPCGD